MSRLVDTTLHIKSKSEAFTIPKSPPTSFPYREMKNSDVWIAGRDKRQVHVHSLLHSQFQKKASVDPGTYIMEVCDIMKERDNPNEYTSKIPKLDLKAPKTGSVIWNLASSVAGLFYQSNDANKLLKAQLALSETVKDFESMISNDSIHNGCNLSLKGLYCTFPLTCIKAVCCTNYTFIH